MRAYDKLISYFFTCFLLLSFLWGLWGYIRKRLEGMVRQAWDVSRGQSEYLQKLCRGEHLPAIDKNNQFYELDILILTDLQGHVATATARFLIHGLHAWIFAWIFLSTPHGFLKNWPRISMDFFVQPPWIFEKLAKDLPWIFEKITKDFFFGGGRKAYPMNPFVGTVIRSAANSR